MRISNSTPHQSNINTNCNPKVNLNQLHVITSKLPRQMILVEKKLGSNLEQTRLICIKLVLDIASNDVMKWVLVSNLKGVGSEGLDLLLLNIE